MVLVVEIGGLGTESPRSWRSWSFCVDIKV